VPVLIDHLGQVRNDGDRRFALLGLWLFFVPTPDLPPDIKIAIDAIFPLGTVCVCSVKGVPGLYG